MDHRDFSVFLVGQFLAACIAVLLGRITALLDHFIQHSQCPGVIDFDAPGTQN